MSYSSLASLRFVDILHYLHARYLLHFVFFALILSLPLVIIALRILRIILDLYLTGLDKVILQVHVTPSATIFLLEWRLRPYCLFLLLRFPYTYPTTSKSFGRLLDFILLFNWSSTCIPLEEFVPTCFISCFLRANSYITCVADPQLGRRGLS